MAASHERRNGPGTEGAVVNVQRLTTGDAETWNGLVDRSPAVTPFHRFGALSVMAAHSGTTLHPLVGYKGEEPVGLFPVFTVEKGFVTAAFSPPPDLKVSYLGPALVPSDDLNQRKRELRRRRFVDAVLDWIDEAFDPRYLSVRTSPTHGDPRPFDWHGYRTRPNFTYVVDLPDDESDLLETVTSDLRRNIRQGREADCEIERVGVEGIEPIISQVRDRHAAQGLSYNVTTEFVCDLVTALPADCIHVYVCRRDGAFLGGNVVLDTAGTAYGWQGLAKTDHDLPVNDLVHWEVIRDAIERGATEYDLVGANERRLARYKAKFSPRLARYHSVEHTTMVTKAAAEVYKRLR
ncbi:GNAT family N-acetyltransferase [Halorientalis salina]|uniref:GNAT family N-acetyltransferase n=1 Tax=Halorientalis salina TaxID=2932266 RepID=UPI002022A60D|nr:GNAT family N-acetyltransferase [Halorientalis salina]